MLDWLSQNKTKTSSNSEPLDRSAEVRVIGDRASGKTAYMASLAYWPNANTSSPVQTVTPINDDANELVAKAQNILEQGLQLEATDLASVDDIKDYTLSIVLKGEFTWKTPKVTLQPQLVKLNISCKDYAGEFFSDLLHRTGDSLLVDYLEDCVRSTGIMLLVDGTTHRKDSEYEERCG